MANVTGITKVRADEIWNASITSGKIDSNGQLILKTRGGTEINAGPIIAPKAAVEKAHPVGSIFIHTSDTNPADLLGIGTWARFATGRTLIGVDEGQTEFDSPLETGGEKTVKLTEAQLPAHDHPVSLSFNYGANTTRGGDAARVSGIAFGTTEDNDRHGNTANAGSGAAHNNLPPYITVYMWRRTE